MFLAHTKPHALYFPPSAGNYRPIHRHEPLDGRTTITRAPLRDILTAQLLFTAY